MKCEVGFIHFDKTIKSPVNSIRIMTDNLTEGATIGCTDAIVKVFPDAKQYKILEITEFGNIARILNIFTELGWKEYKQ
jgi:hypothetical protein